MLAAERHRQIIEIIERDHSITIARLKTLFPVTTMTLWRDLERLEHSGKIKRVRGGAILNRDEAETEIGIKGLRELKAKQKIAQAAVNAFVKDTMHLIMDGGSTVAELCPYLAERRVTVLTHSLTILNRLQHDCPNNSCHASGGILRSVSGTFVGPDAVRFFRRKKADIFFMSVTGLDAKAGLTDPNPLEIEVKQAMIQSAKKTVLLIDKSKIGTVSLCPVVPFRRIQAIVTDDAELKLKFPLLSEKNFTVISV